MRTWGLSPAQRDQVWACWRRGQTVRTIAHEVGRHEAKVWSYLAQHGGCPPAPRRRAPRALTPAERGEVSRGLAAGDSCRVIATRLGRAPSTVSREVARNGGPAHYRAEAADAATWRRARRPKSSVLATRSALRAIVERKLEARWSPEQIAHWLPRAYPDDASMRVSHETIYLSLFVQARGALRRELVQHLRSRRVMRTPRGVRAQRTHGGSRLRDMVSIRERPAEVEDRAVPGHWEGDLLLGRGRSGIGTLVERTTRYTLLIALPDGYKAPAVRTALAGAITRLPTQLRRSLTWDQGREMGDHAGFTVDTGVQVYFCDPRSPWQRGTNENTNGLLRQYLPTGTDLRARDQAALDAIAAELNERPRQTLAWRTPAECLLALTEAG